MAKSARASSNKKNNARLRSKVHGPVEQARVERLSQKLTELAQQPNPNQSHEINIVKATRPDATADATGDAAMSGVVSTARKPKRTKPFQRKVKSGSWLQQVREVKKAKKEAKKEKKRTKERNRMTFKNANKKRGTK